MGGGDRRELTRVRPRSRSRSLVGLLGLLLLVGAGVLYVRNRYRAPVGPGTTIQSLGPLAQRGVFRVAFWRSEEPRTVRFVAATPRWAQTFAGTAGPSGVSVRPVTGQTRWAGWHGEAYAHFDGDTVSLRSPHWTPAREVAESVVGMRDYYPAWSAGGERFAFVTGDADGVPKRVRVFSRDGELVADAELPSGIRGWHVMALSPSGRRVLLLVESPRGNGVLLSEPDWQATVVRMPGGTLQSPIWVNEEVVAGVTWEEGASAPWRIRFVCPAKGDEVGRLDATRVSLGGVRNYNVVLYRLQAAPSGDGIIAAFIGYSQAGMAVWEVKDKLAPAGTGPPWMNSAVAWANQHPPPVVGYVYVPVTGDSWRPIAVDEWTLRGCRPSEAFAASADGTELLYMSDWELKAAPLPAEARATASERSRGE